jgi:GT2 family glycosyltransferase
MVHDIVVSIINYRTADMTLDCARAVLDDLGDLRGRIVIVDNHSDDGSAEQIGDWLADQPEGTPVELILSPTNTGFSGGHNQALAAAEADFYLILNSDAIVRPGMMRALVDSGRAHPDHGFIAPRIEREDGSIQNSCFRFHGPLSELVRAARSGPITRLLRRHDVALGTDPDPAAIDWASFACILLRGEMVRALGPMDEGYFLYFEDVEYCLRGRRAGWKIRQEPAAKVIHLRGGSGPVKSLYNQRKRLPRYFYSSRTRLLYQTHGFAGLLGSNLAWHLGRLIKWSYLLAGRKPDSITQAEWRDIWTNFTRPLGPRFAPGDTE